MTFKTDFGYNEDDYVEENRALRELTVTITLCEYRDLIRENSRLEIENKKLNNDIKEEQEKSIQLARLLMNTEKGRETVEKTLGIFSDIWKENSEEKFDQEEEHDGPGAL